MKERPILFSGPMVRAILDGRKTQTRRVVKPQPVYEEGLWKFAWGAGCSLDWMPVIPGHATANRCPYGKAGQDSLWVRETWRVSSEGNHTPDGANGTKQIYCTYRANDRGWYPGARQQRTDFLTPQDDDLAAKAWGNGKSGSWRPSIHMPRWASRITLRITDVRVQRVRDISEADCIAEGIRCGEEKWIDAPDGRQWEDMYGWYVPPMSNRYNAPSHAFRVLWDSINGRRGYGWDVNPFVWALTFEVVHAPQERPQ